MNRLDPTTLQLDSHYVPIYEQEPEFHEVMAEQLRRAPWLAVSILAHGVALVFLMLLPQEAPQEDEVATHVIRPEEVPDAEPPEPPPPEVPKPEDPPDEPILDEPVDTPTETDTPNPSEFDNETQAFTESAFNHNQWNTALGPGGGAGGPYGGRPNGGGGRRGQSFSPQVGLALEWLAAHQDPEGRWDADEFMKHDDPAKGPRCDGPGNPVHDVGLTGLALLAFLGEGSTLRSGDYRDEIKRAVRWLLTQQQDDGCVGGHAAHDFIYDHAIATYALVEAAGLSEARLIRDEVQQALNYLNAHRNPYMVWRYQPQDNANDTSVTGWCIMALKSAKHFDFTVDPNALECAAVWLDQVADPTTGRHGYTQRGELSARQSDSHAAAFPREKNESMTAVGLFCRHFMGQDPKEHPVMEKAADLLASKPPIHNEADGSIDHYAWHYGTYALFQAGGDPWKRWSKHLKAAVAESQRPDGNHRGSWDPNGAWGHEGGRVYATALNALTLQVHYRYSRILR